jgi:membrane dipeptidase
MSDEMIRALAGKGGVIQINFGSAFLTAEAMVWYEQRSEAQKAFLKESGFDKQSAEAKAFEKSYRQDHPIPYATMDDLVASFQHVIELVGVDHVGIGSDFDGVGDSLPVGMKDVSQYPNLIERLLGLGYSDVEIAKIMGGNLIRVWQAAEGHARNVAAEASAP